MRAVRRHSARALPARERARDAARVARRVASYRQQPRAAALAARLAAAAELGDGGGGTPSASGALEAHVALGDAGTANLERVFTVPGGEARVEWRTARLALHVLLQCAGAHRALRGAACWRDRALAAALRPPQLPGAAADAHASPARAAFDTADGD